MKTPSPNGYKEFCSYPHLQIHFDLQNKVISYLSWKNKSQPLVSSEWQVREGGDNINGYRKRHLVYEFLKPRREDFISIRSRC